MLCGLTTTPLNPSALDENVDLLQIHCQLLKILEKDNSQDML